MTRLQPNASSRTGRFLLPFAGAALLASCASITSFSAVPRNACVGNAVDVAWHASGRVSLASVPVLPGAGSQPRIGSRSFVVTESTTFVLTAEGFLGMRKTAEADIDVAPPVHAFGAVASCDSATGRLETSFVLDRQLAPAFLVHKLGNPLNRQLQIEKDGRVSTLPPHTETQDGNGLPARGTWRLTSPLAPAETCDSALRSVRQRLQFELHLVCGR